MSRKGLQEPGTPVRACTHLGLLDSSLAQGPQTDTSGTERSGQNRRTGEGWVHPSLPGCFWGLALSDGVSSLRRQARGGGACRGKKKRKTKYFFLMDRLPMETGWK